VYNELSGMPIAIEACADRIVEVDVCADSSLVDLHHGSVVVAHCHLRVAGVSLHNFTHCFQLHTHTDAAFRFVFATVLHFVRFGSLIDRNKCGKTV